MAQDRVAPGEHLRATIVRLGFDQVGLSKALGVSRQSINNIINGRQAISRAMARKLGVLTRKPSGYWLRDSFPKQHSEPMPVAVRQPAARATNAQSASFAAFIDESPPVPDSLRVIVDKIRRIEAFVAVDTWGALRNKLRHVGSSDDEIAAARALWLCYESWRGTRDRF